MLHVVFFYQCAQLSSAAPADRIVTVNRVVELHLYRVTCFHPTDNNELV